VKHKYHGDPVELKKDFSADGTTYPANTKAVVEAGLNRRGKYLIRINDKLVTIPWSYLK
jgi:hypothetical protein